MLPINRHPNARELRTFARIWFPLFVVVAGALTWWRGESPAAAAVVWIVGVVIAALIWASAEAARIFFVGFMTITYPIGLIVSTIALGFMFYIVFTPLGFFMRLAGRDPLQLKSRAAPSNWTPYEQDDSAERAFRQY
jgi:saxitoxin biosynthesis operon SxtJ-like protein